MISRTTRFLVAAGMAFALPAGTALGQDAGDKLIPTPVIYGTVEEGAYLYGQIDKGLLVHDDGQDTESYFPVDNGNSSTRFGAWLNETVGDGLRFSANFEFEWNPYATGTVNQLNRDDVKWDETKIRKLEGVLHSASYGTLWLGEGSMASDGTSEADLSGTGLAAYSSIGDSAGGQLIAFSGNAGLSDIAISSGFDNLDGLGRKLRARYDSPVVSGFGVGASVGSDRSDDSDEPVWDVAASYIGDADGVKVAAAAAWSRIYVSDAIGRINRISTSLSVLHEATGVNVTVAGGQEDRPANDPNFLYGKLGWRPALTRAGATAFAVDAYFGSDFAVDGSDSTSFGAAAVQTIDDYQLDLYVTARLYDFDAPGAGYEEAFSVLTGARFWF